MFLKYGWPNGPHCPFCGSKNIIRYGSYEKYYHRYLCKDCSEKNKKLTVFNDKTCTIFEGTKLRLTTWFLAGYLMKFGLSNNQIAEELNIEENTARRMCNLMIGSMFFHNCLQKLSGTVEIDEAYQTAGSKGNGINTQQGNKERLPLYTAGFEFFRNIKKKVEDVLNELIKLCLNSPARDLLNVETNLVPPLLCPGVPTMF
jgi:transposase-like protein